VALFWVSLFSLELGFKPLPLAGVATGQDVPQVYRWLAAKQLDGPILEFPVGESFYQALQYMYFSTYHWLPLVNGTSRFLPPTHEQLNAEMSSLPSLEAVEILRNLGVKGVVVHSDQLTPEEATRWRDINLAGLGLEEVARFGSAVVYKLSPSHSTTDRSLVLAMPDRIGEGEGTRLPARALMKVGLLLESRGRQLWVHPPPLGATPVQIKWEGMETGQVKIEQQKVKFPLVIRAGEVWATGLPIRTPSAPGQYTLSLNVPTLGLNTTAKPVEIGPKPFQTSATSSQSLSAAYVLEQPSVRMITSRAIDVRLQATNTGKTIWLADAREERGKVRLGWRWLRGNDSRPFKEGREDLLYDVFPGQAYRFKTRIDPPQEPGEYTLELGLVSELLTWFSDRGVTPLTLHVQVPQGG
jgi:hypothetical protein